MHDQKASIIPLSRLQGIHRMKIEMPSAHPSQTQTGSNQPVQNKNPMKNIPNDQTGKAAGLKPATNPGQVNPEQQKVPAPATVQIRTVFMDEVKQNKAIDLAREACANEKMSQSPREIAGHIKNHFDALYGPAWHCIVGRSYGSFVTHGNPFYLFLFIFA